MYEIIQAQNLANQIEKNSDISDHAILTTELIWSTFDQLQSEQVSIAQPLVKKLKIQRKMPVNFLESDIANKSILQLIEKQEKQIENQQQIDELYKQFLAIYFDELKKLNLIKNSCPTKKETSHGGPKNYKIYGMKQ